jgi:hypothetical protein
MSLMVVMTHREARAGALSETATAALASASRQGFGAPETVDWQGGRVWWFNTPANPGSSGALVRETDRWAACTGSVHWQGLTGEPLLRKLLRDFDRPQDMPLRDFCGSFAMVFSAGGATWLFNDAVGIHKIYSCLDGQVHSSSLLLCRHLLREPRVDRLRAQEYVLLGGTHALQTPIAGVTVLEPTQGLELVSGQKATLYPSQAWRIAARLKSPDEAVDTLSAMIAAEFAGMRQAFSGPIGMALSGGFDSRLILAALDHHKVSPRLYVYGAKDMDDVQIATAKAADLELPIECVDKRRANAELPVLSRQRLQDNIHFFDGLPVDGVFDRGTDQATRLGQVHGGTLNLNGGGGEILRNFFYLPDKGFSANDLVGAFYCNWLPAVISDPSERQAFTEASADGILNCLGLSCGSGATRRAPLLRSDAELVYSLFRLRYWMGRNNSLAGRYGAFMTPLVSPRLVELAATVPVGWKTYGQLEASIITRLSRRVASGPSNYGFDFSLGPSQEHRRYITATLHRPIALRRRSARIRRLLGRNDTPSVPAEWLQAWTPPACEWLDVRYLTEMAQINRLMSLQAVLNDGLCGLA